MVSKLYVSEDREYINMINTILVLLWILSIVGIFYFWKRKPNKSYKRASIIACVILFFAIGLLPENQKQVNKTTKSSKVSSSSSNPTKSKSGSSTASKSSSTNKDQAKKDYQTKLQSFAQSFGTKPVEEIQRMPSTYVTTQDQYGNTVYGWHPEGLPELVRVDSENSNTDVYLFDSQGENKMLGKHLYHGRTIFQKQRRPIVYD